MNGTAILAELLTTSEGKTLKFKRDLSSLRPILKSLVAFANTAGGTLVIGRADDGAIVGVDNVLAEEERLANAIADGIRPAITPEIDIVSHEGVGRLRSGVAGRVPATSGSRSRGDETVDVPVNVPVNVPINESFNERQHWLLDQLSQGRRLKPGDIAIQFGVTEKTAKRDFADIKARGLIEFVGAPKTGSYRLTKAH